MRMSYASFIEIWKHLFIPNKQTTCGSGKENLPEMTKEEALTGRKRKKKDPGLLTVLFSLLLGDTG